jgi:hypothetical protein
LAEVKERGGSGDSSGEEDSDDEDEGNRSQQDSSAHDEVSHLLYLITSDRTKQPYSDLKKVICFFNNCIHFKFLFDSYNVYRF